MYLFLNIIVCAFILKLFKLNYESPTDDLVLKNIKYNKKADHYEVTWIENNCDDYALIKLRRYVEDEDCWMTIADLKEYKIARKNESVTLIKDQKLKTGRYKISTTNGEVESPVVHIKINK